MNKPLLVFSLIFISQLVTSCVMCDGDPIRIRSGDPTLTSLELSTSNDPNIFVTTDLNELAIKRFDSLIFELQFAEIQSAINSNNNGGFGTALACDPVVHFDEIASIEIYSDKDYAGYSAGQNLAGLFLLSSNNYANFSAVSSFWKFNLPYDILQFKLHASPGALSVHTFTFTIEMMDDRVFTLTSIPITVRP